MKSRRKYKYDLIIIGTPIRIGMIDRKIKKFLIDNIEVLKGKKSCIFYMLWFQ